MCECEYSEDSVLAYEPAEPVKKTTCQSNISCVLTMRTKAAQRDDALPDSLFNIAAKIRCCSGSSKPGRIGACKNHGKSCEEIYEHWSS